MAAENWRASRRSQPGPPCGIWRVRVAAAVLPSRGMSGGGVLALGCVLAAVTSGCGAKLREIPTHSLSKRSPVVVERDIPQCEKSVTGHLKGPWLGGELEFAACMIARNSQTFVQVLDAPLEVRRASLKGKVTSARVLNDLVACEQFVSARVSVVEKIGRPLVTVAGLLFWPVGFGASTASPALAGQRPRDYIACIEPPGYTISNWKSETGALPPPGAGPS